MAYASEQIDAARVRFQRYADMRYQGQEHAVQIPVAGGQFDQAALLALLELFGDEYENKYSYRLDNQVELVSFYLVAYAVVDRPELASIPPLKDLSEAVKGQRDVDFDAAGVHVADIYDRDKLGAGSEFSGPAVVEEAGSTTVVFPEQRVAVDDYGNLHITTTA